MKFDFTSTRKRSSIIVYDGYENKIKLYIKGADDVIKLKLHLNYNYSLLETLKSYITKLAKKGLRTLVYGFKFIDESEFSNWEKDYNSIKIEVIRNKLKANDLEAIISKIEQDIIILGVTGLEDKLQDNVKECIKDCRHQCLDVYW